MGLRRMGVMGSRSWMDWDRKAIIRQAIKASGLLDGKRVSC